MIGLAIYATAGLHLLGCQIKKGPYSDPFYVYLLPLDKRKTVLKSQSLQYHRLTYLNEHILIHNDLVDKHPAFAALTLVPGG